MTRQSEGGRKEQEGKTDVGQTDSGEQRFRRSLGNEVVALCRCSVQVERAGREGGGVRAQIALMHAIAVSHAEMNAATGAIATHVVTLDRKLLLWGRPRARPR